MSTESKIISTNRKTWDKVADLFADASALPFWGPFGIGADLNLIPKIKGKTFLEIGFGSGRSIKYLTDKGAKRVYGIDLSPKQYEAAARYNGSAVKNGKARLILGAMEKRYAIPPVDVAFSIYGIGWTPNPKKTFKNVYLYLEQGGLFIWSWDHTFFTDVQYADGEYFVKYSYHEEKPIAMKNWKKSDSTAHLTYRKTSTWFRLLRQAGFDIIGYHEPSPVNLDRGSKDPKKHYSIQKAKKVPATFIFVCRKGGSTQRPKE